jgi:hypothetical protein
MEQATIAKAILWFESMGYHVEQGRGLVRLELDGFSVQLTDNEIKQRAAQWDSELLREN